MREYPILFKGELVRAVLDCRKTETRRLFRCREAEEEGVKVVDVTQVGPNEWRPTLVSAASRWMGDVVRCPFGSAGGRLWVRETWALAHMSVDCEGVCADVEEFEGRPTAADCDGYWRPIYAADADDIDNHPDDRVVRRYRPSIHMPRWASRILLEVSAVTVERVQGIDEDGANYEGFRERAEFAAVWDSIYAASGAGWEADPWAWVVKFKVMEACK